MVSNRVKDVVATTANFSAGDSRRFFWFAAVKQRMILRMLSTTSTPQSPSAEDFAQDVLDYCQRYGVLPSLMAAAGLASEVFLSARDIAVRTQADPETEQTRIVVDVAVVGEADEILRQKAEYTRRWVELATPEVRDRIRVLYHFT